MYMYIIACLCMESEYISSTLHAIDLYRIKLKDVQADIWTTKYWYIYTGLVHTTSGNEESKFSTYPETSLAEHISS